jgi:hypothetical protein
MRSISIEPGYGSWVWAIPGTVTIKTQKKHIPRQLLIILLPEGAHVVS